MEVIRALEFKKSISLDQVKETEEINKPQYYLFNDADAFTPACLRDIQVEENARIDAQLESDLETDAFREHQRILQEFEE